VVVLRFKVRCQPDRADALAAALAEVVPASRAVDGVVEFDIARDLTDPNCFIATEVFEDEQARARQEALPQVQRVMTLMPESVTAAPEATVFHVSSSEPAM
jgi:quinol monooxygenase YgiN